MVPDGQFDQLRPNAATEPWQSSAGELPWQREGWGVRDLDTLRVDGARMGEDDSLTEHIEEPHLELHLMRQGLRPSSLNLGCGIGKCELMLRWRSHLGHHNRLAKRCPPASIGKCEKIRNHVVRDAVAVSVEFELDGDVLLTMEVDVCRAGSRQQRRVLELKVLPSVLFVLAPLLSFGQALTSLQPSLVAENKECAHRADGSERNPARPAPSLP